MTTPLISVVMPVRNARPFLDVSIASISNQTLDDFEFVILDDASSDGSDELLRRWSRRDRRIVVHQSPNRLGLTGSSNFVVSKSSAPIIARMDADDVSHPDRLRRQLAIMNSHAEVAAVGTLSDGIDAMGRLVRPRDRWRLVRRSTFSPFPHGSVMFRRQAFDDLGGYRHSCLDGEDQDLLRRMAVMGRLVTLPEVLYHYRYHLANSTLVGYVSGLKSNGSNPNENLAATFYSLGAMRLWAGYSPDILTAMLANIGLRFDPDTLKVLTWASWGSLSPGVLDISTAQSFARVIFCSACALKMGDLTNGDSSNRCWDGRKGPGLGRSTSQQSRVRSRGLR
jgi:glycosyltransferase involved in cell wall biosynthesis